LLPHAWIALRKIGELRESIPYQARRFDLPAGSRLHPPPDRERPLSSNPGIERPSGLRVAPHRSPGSARHRAATVVVRLPIITAGWRA
jgi:hypothetical protein